jgi:hypothetical protein
MTEQAISQKTVADRYEQEFGDKNPENLQIHQLWGFIHHMYLAEFSIQEIEAFFVETPGLYAWAHAELIEIDIREKLIIELSNRMRASATTHITELLLQQKALGTTPEKIVKYLDILTEALSDNYPFSGNHNDDIAAFNRIAEEVEENIK